MMIEDFVGSETCITKMLTIAGGGFTVQAHAGDLPKSAKYGGFGAGNTCVDGDTNSMAAGDFFKRLFVTLFSTISLVSPWFSSGTLLDHAVAPWEVLGCDPPSFPRL
jgi:hypothetical protein